ncbi:MAG TPA: Crp/Fnr family transcriptional regulator [Microthrixaceae bacterium]|nr:Crp/Fnr family transcriptional regulator [Microthrixaceae bacterium]
MGNSAALDDLPPSFLETIDDPARAALDRLGVRRRFKPGTTVMAEGESATRLGIVRCGLVKLTASHPDGYETVLAIRGAGELIGELSVFDGRARSATISTLVACEVQFVESREFHALIDEHPGIAVAVIRTLVGRLRQSDSHRVCFGADGVGTRLARELLQLADQHGDVLPDGTIHINLPFTQDDLAGVVSASRDAVARALKTWRAQGLVATGRRRIELLDPAALSRQYRL